jgi:hypothetical protein
MERTFWIGLYPGLTEDMLGCTVDRMVAFFHSRL